MIVAYNGKSERLTSQRGAILRELIPGGAEGLFVQAPFYCDYGCVSVIYLVTLSSLTT